MSANVNKFKVTINDYEKALLNELCEQRGFIYNDVFKVALRAFHKKEFPRYVQKELKKDLPPEQRCIIEGGRIDIVDGVKMCKVKRGELEYEYPVGEEDK